MSGYGHRSPSDAPGTWSVTVPSRVKSRQPTWTFELRPAGTTCAQVSTVPGAIQTPDPPSSGVPAMSTPSRTRQSPASSRSLTLRSATATAVHASAVGELASEAEDVAVLSPFHPRVTLTLAVAPASASMLITLPDFRASSSPNSTSTSSGKRLSTAWWRLADRPRTVRPSSSTSRRCSPADATFCGPSTATLAQMTSPVGSCTCSGLLLISHPANP